MDELNKPFNILVVDDLSENLKVLVSMLDQEGYQVRPVNSGRLALQSTNAQKPDLILLDIRMPEMDGYEVCAKLKSNQETQDIPIIFISAYQDIEDKLKAFHVGGADYISKPFYIEEVQARVKIQLEMQALRQRDKAYIDQLSKEIESREEAEALLKQHKEQLEKTVEKRTVELGDALQKERSTRAQLIHAEKLVGMGRMAASIAHEINNPLQSVVGCLGLAQEALEEGTDTEQYLQIAHAEVHRAARTVGQMRDLYRPVSEDDKKVPSQINTILKDILALTRKQFEEKEIEVIWQSNKNLPLIKIIPDQIKQVFLNLLLNALDALPEGGEVKINTSLTGHPAGINLEISDNGAGIYPNDLEQIFDPFFTTKSKGSGLGLAISFGIINHHEGQITAESEVGVGSKFNIWLPE
ncbi:MAG: response regulator [Chloroflexota bacterium]